ncbi:hypothetical protein JYT48_02140 [Mariprofundus ferrooxydans]|nr:hypothetical protein [Mariprofundus ferrooxydans]MBN4077051.1 hypothetical protein [Mariprofundus ferrooxydans]
MPKKKNIKVGTTQPGDLKVRKKNPPPTQVQKSPKDYDRKKLKRQDRKEGLSEET